MAVCCWQAMAAIAAIATAATAVGCCWLLFAIAAGIAAAIAGLMSCHCLHCAALQSSGGTTPSTAGRASPTPSVSDAERCKAMPALLLPSLLMPD